MIKAEVSENLITKRKNKYINEEKPKSKKALPALYHSTELYSHVRTDLEEQFPIKT